MRARLLAAAFCAVLLLHSARTAQARPGTSPRFADYPASAAFAGRNHLVLGRADLGYRSRLSEVARQRPDFAGHYVLVLWGCGAECLMGAAIDVRSGRVTWLPGDTICCWFSGPQEQAQDIDPVRYRLHSRLLVLNGLRGEREGDLGQRYHAIRDGRFVHLLDVRPASGP
jgi:hypothetical protein